MITSPSKKKQLTSFKNNHHCFTGKQSKKKKKKFRNLVHFSRLLHTAVLALSTTPPFCVSINISNNFRNWRSRIPYQEFSLPNFLPLLRQALRRKETISTAKALYRLQNSHTTKIKAQPKRDQSTNGYLVFNWKLYNQPKRAQIIIQRDQTAKWFVSSPLLMLIMQYMKHWEGQRSKSPQNMSAISQERQIL